MNSRSRPGSVDYMVDRICEPILSTRFASSELCRSLQDENRAYADLIDHLGTLTRNAMRLPLRGTHRFTLYSTPTRLQEATFSLLQGHLGREFPAIPRLDPFAVGGWTNASTVASTRSHK
jgi:hypothetical protein